jgi:hypothetical protein
MTWKLSRSGRGRRGQDCPLWGWGSDREQPGKNLSDVIERLSSLGLEAEVKVRPVDRSREAIDITPKEAEWCGGSPRPEAQLRPGSAQQVASAFAASAGLLVADVGDALALVEEPQGRLGTLTLHTGADDAEDGTRFLEIGEELGAVGGASSTECRHTISIGREWALLYHSGDHPAIVAMTQLRR